MSVPIRSARAREAVMFTAVAVVVSTVLALRSVGSKYLTVRLNREFIISDLDERVIWVLMYWAMWLALTPFIFASARRYPFRRDRWVGPLIVHSALAVTVSSVGLVLLSVFYGGTVLDWGWAAPSALISPAWVRLAAVHAVTDSLVYGVILAGGHALCLYDDYQARRIRTAELERSLVTAQVDALRMKLQPHFLFNTLNSISFLAIEHDSASIQAIVERLGRLLRASMTTGGRQLVPVQEELELLDEYLGIEELRFRDRLHVTRHIAPGVMASHVPSLVLQPIVENSIKHGFSKRMDASRLDIAIERDVDTLVVAVTDDGPGLPAGWDLTTHCGRGLRNVIERLDALYRGQWSFTLRNAVGGGTVAELRIPFVR